jgi:predicted HTH domain antitoxin
MQLSIPDSIVKSIRLPEKRIESELLKELALNLYQQELLSFGKASELANMEHYEFSNLLGERGICRHHSQQELEEDLNYVRYR